MPDLHKIDFVNPTFHSGLNITVRHGDRWTKLARIGDRLQIAGREGEIQAPLVGMFYSDLRDIPQAFLDLEHDGDARTHAGLKTILDQIYGPTQDGERMVTTLFFLIE
ncbi:hypothetical protein [Oceaniglobus ichthyenteri]|uniref:hypothetical protein n=1 Tax=Oceaniglobus ichthyenteri TaxID=2136177 RepID=UPI000D3C5CDD|nr:hypothetical protein [Oceaniglobus ichthyenteri]